MKKKIVKVVVGIVIVLAIALFLVANFRMVRHNYDNVGEVRDSCEGLKVGDSCEIMSKKGEVVGICRDSVRGKLVCKIGSKGKK